MTETFFAVNGQLFRLTLTPKRAERVSVLRGGTWNDRPIRAQWYDEGRRGPAGVFIDERFVSLKSIKSSPEAADPLVR